MPDLITIQAAKEQAGGSCLQPLLLAEFQFQDGALLRLSSENLDSGLGGPQWNGVDWQPRLMGQSLEAMSSRSTNGIIQSPNVTVTIADGDRAIWTGYELTSGRGFKGAKLRLYFVYWQAGTSTFTSDYRVIFVGICNPAGCDATTVTVTADNLLNMTRQTLPTARVQTSCFKIFPSTFEQRLAGSQNPDSLYFPCGYSPDIANTDARGNMDPATGQPYVSCGYTFSECVLRMGNASLGRSAEPGQQMQIEVDQAGRTTARFSGIYWNGPLDWRGVDYLTGSDKAEGINNPNEAKFNDYYPLIYGEAMVEPIVMNVVGDANSTRFEVAITVGQIPFTQDGSVPGGIQAVIVNDMLIPFHTQTGDLLNRWYWGTTGDRSGRTMKGPIYNGAGNCYGSIATLLIIVPKSVQASSGIPRVHVLTAGPAVKIFTAANAGSYFEDFTRTPIWHLLDMLLRAGWTLDQIDLQSFIDEAAYCDEQITYQAIDGTTKTHERFRSGLVYRTPRTVAECLQNFLASFRGFLYQASSDGNLRVGIRKSLADQQPQPISSSNSSAPLTSVKATGAGANGYVAYAFDPSNIKMVADGDNWKPLLQFSQRRYSDTPNKATATFQDEEQFFVGDTLSLVDTDDISRIGQQIKGNLQAEGFLNYDQAFRLLESMEAEQFRGNPRTPITGTFDTGGTLEAQLVTTAKVIDLRCGQISSLTFPFYGINGWVMRVTDISYSPDCEEVTVRLAYHKDEWYRDDYGQRANTYIANPASAFSARPPFAWCPDQENPQATDTFWKPTDYQFAISQNYATSTDGSVKATLSIAGKTPVNVFSKVAGTPQVSTLTAATGGGTVPAGTYWAAIVAKDSAGGRSAPSFAFANATLSGAGKLTVSDIIWTDGTSGYEVYIGSNPNKLSLQATGSGTPASIDVGSYIIAGLGSPDNLFHHFDVDVQRVWHAGVCTCVLTGAGSNTLTVANANWVGGQWVGRTVSILGRGVAGAVVPVANFPITGNSGDTLTVSGDLAAIGIVAGDVIAIRAVAGAATANTLTDAAWVNPVPIPQSPMNVVSIIGTTNAEVTTQLAHGCVTGDQVQLTNCASASELPLGTPGKWTVTVTGLKTLTLDTSSLDPLRNYLAGGILQRLTFGLVPDAEIGRRATILSGTGAGQALRITANTSTGVTLDGTWDVTPDTTSIWVIADDGPWTTVSTNAISNEDPLSQVNLAVPLASNPNTVVLAKVYCASASDARSLISDSPWREIYVPLPASLGLALGPPATLPPATQPVIWIPDPTRPGTIAGVIPNTGGINLQTSNYTIQLSDRGKLIVFNSATPVTATLPAASSLNSTWYAGITNIGAGAVTLAGTIDGQTNLVLTRYTGLDLYTDATNYYSERGDAAVGGAVVKTGSYTAVSSDTGKLLVFNSASPGTFTLPAAPPTPNWNIFVQNIGTGALTLSPSALQIDGSTSSLTLNQNQGVYLTTDGTNYYTERAAGARPFDEVPAGALNGVNRTFTLTYAPAGSGALKSLHCYLNGVYQDIYWITLSGATVTFAVAPTAADQIYAEYEY